MINNKLLDQTEHKSVAHWSDCAVHSEPAYPAGECDCGGFNPVAWLVEDDDGNRLYWTYKEPTKNEKWIPLFSTPPQRKPLTDEEIVKITSDPCLYIRGGDYRIDIARAIEAAHGIKE